MAADSAQKQVLSALLFLPELTVVLFSCLLIMHLRELGESPSRLKGFYTFSIDGDGEDLIQARKISGSILILNYFWNLLKWIIQHWIGKRQ